MRPKALVALEILMQGGCITLNGVDYYMDRDGDLIHKVSYFDFEAENLDNVESAWWKADNINLGWFIRDCEKLSRDELFVRMPISTKTPVYRWQDEERMLGREWFSYEEKT